MAASSTHELPRGCKDFNQLLLKVGMGKNLSIWESIFERMESVAVIGMEMGEDDGLQGFLVQDGSEILEDIIGCFISFHGVNDNATSLACKKHPSRVGACTKFTLTVTFNENAVGQPIPNGHVDAITNQDDLPLELQRVLLQLLRILRWQFGERASHWPLMAQEVLEVVVVLGAAILDKEVEQDDEEDGTDHRQR